MKELNQILNILLINNDKNLSEYILEFLYPKCSICNELKYEHDLFELYNNELICSYCRENSAYIRCHLCARYFKFGDGFCRFCGSPCKVYCYNCKTNTFERRVYIRDIIHMPTLSE